VRLKKGLSLLELVVALGLVAGLVVISSSLFARLLASTDKSGDTAIGLQLAESLLQDAVLAKNFPPLPHSAVIRLYAHDVQSPQEFLYQLTATPKVLQVGQPPIYLMDVSVTWNNAQRAGQGQLRAKLSRLVTP
jgi:hypothetical protein